MLNVSAVPIQYTIVPYIGQGQALEMDIKASGFFVQGARFMDTF